MSRKAPVLITTGCVLIGGALYSIHQHPEQTAKFATNELLADANLLVDQNGSSIAGTMSEEELLTYIHKNHISIGELESNVYHFFEQNDIFEPELAQIYIEQIQEQNPKIWNLDFEIPEDIMENYISTLSPTIEKGEKENLVTGFRYGYNKAKNGIPIDVAITTFMNRFLNGSNLENKDLLDSFETGYNAYENQKIFQK